MRTEHRVREASGSAQPRDGDEPHLALSLRVWERREGGGEEDGVSRSPPSIPSLGSPMAETWRLRSPTRRSRHSVLSAIERGPTSDRLPPFPRGQTDFSNARPSVF